MTALILFRDDRYRVTDLGDHLLLERPRDGSYAVLQAEAAWSLRDKIDRVGCQPWAIDAFQHELRGDYDALLDELWMDRQHAHDQEEKHRHE